MKEQMEKRINELKGELESGQKILEELDIKRTSLVQTLLRISGAIQALEELLAQENNSNS